MATATVLSPGEIRTIAEIVYEKHGNSSTLFNLAFGFIRQVMLDRGYSIEQFETHKIEVSKQVSKIRRENQ